jgi:hypothetical protein
MAGASTPVLIEQAVLDSLLQGTVPSRTFNKAPKLALRTTAPESRVF